MLLVVVAVLPDIFSGAGKFCLERQGGYYSRRQHSTLKCFLHRGIHYTLQKVHFKIIIVVSNRTSQLKINSGSNSREKHGAAVQVPEPVAEQEGTGMAGPAAIPAQLWPLDPPICSFPWDPSGSQSVLGGHNFPGSWTEEGDKVLSPAESDGKE